MFSLCDVLCSVSSELFPKQLGNPVSFGMAMASLTYFTEHDAGERLIPERESGTFGKLRDCLSHCLPSGTCTDVSLLD